MKYANPQRLHIRCAERDLPLPVEIAAKVPAYDFGDGTQLWMIQFHWPTHDHLQDAIAASVAKLAKETAWTSRDAIPLTTISVQETVPDETKLPVDGVLPTKVVAVTRTLKDQAAKYAFVGEARAVAVEAKPVVVAVEK